MQKTARVSDFYRAAIPLSVSLSLSEGRGDIARRNDPLPAAALQSDFILTRGNVYIRLCIASHD